jgi:hypothetical protein
MSLHNLQQTESKMKLVNNGDDRNITLSKSEAVEVIHLLSSNIAELEESCPSFEVSNSPTPLQLLFRLDKSQPHPVLCEETSDVAGQAIATPYLYITLTTWAAAALVGSLVHGLSSKYHHGWGQYAVDTAKKDRTYYLHIDVEK